MDSTKQKPINLTTQELTVLKRKFLEAVNSTRREAGLPEVANIDGGFESFLEDYLSDKARALKSIGGN